MSPVRSLKNIEFIFRIIHLYNLSLFFALSCFGDLTG
jgi:hypothetical protein